MTDKETGKKAVLLDREINKNKEKQKERQLQKRIDKYLPRRRR